MTCGSNPNFVGSPGGWSSGVPSTCLGIAACTSVVGGVTYDTPIYITLKITSGFATPLTATIVNCQTQPSIDHGASCVQSKDESSIPLSHELSWGAPNGDAGPVTTLNITQIGSSDATALCNVPPGQQPGNFVLITDTYGNADIVFFSTVATATCGP
jgi:hypothetical protein